MYVNHRGDRLAKCYVCLDEAAISQAELREEKEDESFIDIVPVLHNSELESG